MEPVARREFLKLLPGLPLSSAPLCASALDMPDGARPAPAGNQLAESVAEWLESDRFPYDREFFDASERVMVFHSGQPGDPRYNGVLNLPPREGLRIDLVVIVSSNRKKLSDRRGLRFKLGDVDRPVSLSFPLDSFESDYVWYQVFYRSGKGKYKSLSPKCFRNPSHEGEVNIGVISDPHCPDDCDRAESGFRIEDENLRQQRLSGDYVNAFLKMLMRDPDWEPEGEARRLANGFNLSSAHAYILRNLGALNYDFLVNLGDVTFIQEYRYEGMGMPRLTYKRNAQALWLAARRRSAGLTPFLPYYLALGNHEGEEERNPAKRFARKFRTLYWPQPGEACGGSPDENYFCIRWGRDGRHQLIILDSDSYHAKAIQGPQDHTLGPEQMFWLKNKLREDADFKAIFFHHVLGGWQSDPECNDTGSYGRGPEFTAWDYSRLNIDPKTIEQVKITKLAVRHGVRLLCYGHDHVWFHRCVGDNAANKPVYAVCCGSTKHYADQWHMNEVDGVNFWERSAYGSAVERRFLGPPGITEIRIGEEGKVSIGYKCIARPHQSSNLSPETRTGDVLDNFSFYL